MYRYMYDAKLFHCTHLYTTVVYRWQLQMTTTDMATTMLATTMSCCQSQTKLVGRVRRGGALAERVIHSSVYIYDVLAHPLYTSVHNQCTHCCMFFDLS